MNICRIWLMSAVVPLVLLFNGMAFPAFAEEYYDRYGLTPASAALDLGTQPLGYPNGVISSVMQRDRLLKAALAGVGHPMTAHAFRRGADMVALLADQRLEAGLLGDMPTILAAATGDVWIVGLVKQTSTAIVSNGNTRVAELAGKRLGYVPLSSAHQTLLQGLASVELGEGDVRLVPLGIEQMPDALARGEIDAFAAWEPAPSVALANNSKNHIVFRGLSADYLVVTRAFEKRSPEAARILVAGFARAIEWMRRSQKNVETAARWVRLDGESLSGKPPAATVEQIVAITRRDILNVPSAPVILTAPNTPPPLKNEFEFLRSQNKLSIKANWDNVASALRYEGLASVLKDPRKYAVHVFDYEQ